MKKRQPKSIIDTPAKIMFRRQLLLIKARNEAIASHIRKGICMSCGKTRLEGDNYNLREIGKNKQQVLFCAKCFKRATNEK